MKVIHVQVGRDPVVRDIENNLDAMQDIVGGNIEVVYDVGLGDNICIIDNEEGKFNSVPNQYFSELEDTVYGDFLIVCYDIDTGKFVDLNDWDVSTCMDRIIFER